MRIWKSLKLKNVSCDWTGEIKNLGDVVMASPSSENVYINRAFNLEKICMDDEMFEYVDGLERHIEFAIRLAILMVNEELRIECPRKFAGQVVFLENSADGRNFCFIYGFGN